MSVTELKESSTGSKITKGDRSRQAILTAAVTLIARRGDTEKVTLRDIAEAAGITLSRLSYYYRTRINLLNQCVTYTLSHRHFTPVLSFLEENRYLLESREGQVLFINDLCSMLRVFFSEISETELNIYNACRALQHSREIETNEEILCLYRKDPVSFYEIFRTITGVDDAEEASFWYSVTLDAYATRISNIKYRHELRLIPGLKADVETRFLYFCRKELLIGLGLWEKNAGNGRGRL